MIMVTVGHKTLNNLHEHNYGYRGSQDIEILCEYVYGYCVSQDIEHPA